MAALAAISLLLMWSSFGKVRIAAEPAKLRVFKQDGAGALLRLGPGSPRWLAFSRLSLLGAPGLKDETRLLDGSFELVLKPVLSDRFVVTAVELQVTDVLGVFSREEPVPMDLVVEALPLALLAPPRIGAGSPLTVGENPAGRSGSGQELYAVGQYDPGLETRDILWKKVARAEDESIPIRVREANIPMSVKVQVALDWGAAEQRAARVDLVNEAVARLGRAFLSLGTSLEVTFPQGELSASRRATNMAELADLLMALSGMAPAKKLPPTVECDLLVTGPEQAGAWRPDSLPGSPLLLAVYDAPPPDVLPLRLHVFSGQEDLSPLATLVLDR